MLLECKINVLPEPQKALWKQLNEVPEKYVLYGGTAIALRYGHRQSVDFDFFSTDQSDIDSLTKDLSFIKNNPPCDEYVKLRGEIKHFHNHNHIDYFLETITPSKPYDPQNSIVKVTFANGKDLIPGAIKSPDEALGNGIKIASPLDLLATKIIAMGRRSKERDFRDLAELIKNGNNLQDGFEAAVAISRLSPLGVNLRYDRLKEDLKAKTIYSILPNDPECAEIIRESAAKLDIDKALKTKLKAEPVNYKQIGIGMGR